MRPIAPLLAIALSTLALTASLASAQTLGEVTAATGLHSTLQRQGVNSSMSARDTVKRSLASSTKPRDYDFESGSGKKSGSRSSDSRSKLALRSNQVASAKGSWVTGASSAKGSVSNAWAKGGAGWDGGSQGWATGGNGWGTSGGAPAGRRSRS